MGDRSRAVSGTGTLADKPGGARRPRALGNDGRRPRSRGQRPRARAARALSMASTQVHITLQHLGLTDDHAMLFDRLASRVFGLDASAANPDDIARNSGGQANLWRFGISGDLPIVLVHVSDTNGLALVRQLLHAQE